MENEPKYETNISEEDIMVEQNYSQTAMENKPGADIKLARAKSKNIKWDTAWW